MAPEIALAAANQIPTDGLVLDPMAGSGTVLRAAAEAGRRAIGYDLDPLAVLMAQVWNNRIEPDALLKSGYDVLARFDEMDKRRRVILPWIDSDPATQAFIKDWFLPRQRADLRRLSFLLKQRRGVIADALRIVLSRLIIRKEGGASLGDDVSHSRPHRRHETDNPFNVASEFERALERLAGVLREQPPPGLAQVRLGDARLLSGLSPSSVSGVITSPPYLNAIDYLRGHRLSLVWLGYQVHTLSKIRSASIGAERGPDAINESLLRRVSEHLGATDELPRAQRRMIQRYVMDIHSMLSATHRVLKREGTALFVVGNSCLRGIFVRNSDALCEIADSLGFRMLDSVERDLPATRRYLPPPVAGGGHGIGNRMRTEVVVRFSKTGGRAAL